MPKPVTPKLTEEDTYESSSDSDEEDGLPRKRILKKLPSGECPHISELSGTASFINELFPMSIDEFYKRYMSDKSDFWQEACKESECSNVRITKWQKKDCHDERKLCFKIPVKHFLAKDTAVTQTQFCKTHDKSSIQFHTSSVSHNVVYSDSFSVDSDWIISSETQNGKLMCWVQITWEVVWKRHVWVRSIIEKNALEGAKEFFDLTIKLAKEKLRKESTIPSVRVTPQDQLLLSPVKAEEAADEESENEGEFEEVEVTKSAAPVSEAPHSLKVSSTGGTNTIAVSGRAHNRGRARLRASRQPTVKQTSPPAPKPPAVSLSGIGTVGLIFLLALCAYFPFYYLNAQMADSNYLESHRQGLTSSLNERFVFVQSLLGQLSRNITLVPGKSVFDQWERHWMTQLNETDLEKPHFFIDADRHVFSFVSSLFGMLTNFVWFSSGIATFGLFVSLIGVGVYWAFFV